MRKWIPMLVLALLAAACGRSSQPPRYIFLLTLDTTRADAVDFTPGNPRTPNLAALAARGRTWSHAFSHIPITLPSHLNMLYSLPPHVLKVYNNGQIQAVPHPTVTQLLEAKHYRGAAVISLGVLKKDFGASKGFAEYLENFRPNLWYRTAAEVTNDAIATLDRFRQGKAFFWFHYSDPHEPYFPPRFSETFRILVNGREVHRNLSIEQPRVNVDILAAPGKTRLEMKTEIPAEFLKAKQSEVRYISYQDFSVLPESGAEKAIEVQTPPHWRRTNNPRRLDYLSSRPQSPLLILNHGNRPYRVRLSFIYRMLESPAARPRLYREQVHYMDGQIGRLLDAVRERGMMADSLFLVIGDHGEGLGEYHNHYGHIHYLNPVYTHIPLILSGKGVTPGPPSTDLVSTLDVAPTLLDAANQEIPDFMEGLSLLDKLPSRRLVLETYSPEAYFDAFSIVDPPWQIIHYPGRPHEKVELINLETDPLGVHNLFNSSEVDSKVRSSLYNALLKISRVLTAAKGRVGRMERRHEEILKSLGYL